MGKITNNSANPVDIEVYQLVTLDPGDEFIFPNGYDIKIK